MEHVFGRDIAPGPWMVAKETQGFTRTQAGGLIVTHNFLGR